jgi:hypothetical protein
MFYSRQATLIAIVLLQGIITPAASSRPSKEVVPGKLISAFFEELCSKGCTEGEKARWRENFRSELHDINGDSVAEYFLYVDHADWCGAGGSNCMYWVYQKTAGGYKLLLAAPRVAPLKSLTKGYRDLYGDFRMGAARQRGKFEYYRTIYKFNGEKYEESSQRLIFKKG